MNKNNFSSLQLNGGANLDLLINAANTVNDKNKKTNLVSREINKMAEIFINILKTSEPIWRQFTELFLHNNGLINLLKTNNKTQFATILIKHINDPSNIYFLLVDQTLNDVLYYCTLNNYYNTFSYYIIPYNQAQNYIYLAYYK